MNEELFKDLLDKYLTDSLSESERTELSGLMSHSEYHSSFENILSEEFKSRRFEEGEHEEVLALIRENIKSAISKSKMRKILFMPRWAAAAIIIGISIGTYFTIHNRKQKQPVTSVSSVQPDITPGGNKAVLTLSNGSTIFLDSAVVGAILIQGNSNVIKADSGKIFYKTDNSKAREIVFNTLSTPRGGQFQLILPDGSKVWLNAASSISYPTAFAGKERRVSVTGEVYFEVVHNAKQPFIVDAGGTEIKDVGTHFNINAYSDENSIKTSLLQGSVKVTSRKTNQSEVISPGEQADINGDHLTIVRNVNMEEVMAWKEGSFHFESADLKTILRQFARWYDVEVVYEGAIPDEKYFVMINRNHTLASVLKALQAGNIHFSIENKKLIVKQK